MLISENFIQSNFILEKVVIPSPMVLTINKTEFGAIFGKLIIYSLRGRSG